MSEWYLAKAEDLYEVLRASDPAAPCWTFSDGDATAGFWARRQAHETVVHGVDLALAGDHAPRVVPPRLAVDGVSEVLEVFLGRMQRRAEEAEHPQPDEEPVGWLPVLHPCRHEQRVAMTGGQVAQVAAQRHR